MQSNLTFCVFKPWFHIIGKRFILIIFFTVFTFLFSRDIYSKHLLTLFVISQLLTLWGILRTKYNWLNVDAIHLYYFWKIFNFLFKDFCNISYVWTIKSLCFERIYIFLLNNGLYMAWVCLKLKLKLYHDSVVLTFQI